MKTKVMYVMALLLPFSLGCAEKSSETTLAEVNTLVQQSLLENQMSLADEEYLAALDEIEENITYINKSRGIILQYQPETGESRIDQRERIVRNIQLINSLMDENDAKIEKLQSMIKKSDADNKFLTLTVNKLKSELSEQRESVNSLKKELLHREYDITELNLKLNRVLMDRDNMFCEMEDLQNELNTAYYVIGSYKELKEIGVVEKTGGIFSLGSTKVLNTDFDQSDFSPIDTHDSIILVYGRKAKLITQHPVHSYEFVEENNHVSYLQITEPDQFWKASKYLVVEVK